MIRARVATNVSGLDALSKESQKRTATLKGARAGGQVLNRAAKAQAPKVSGALRSAQGYLAKKGREGLTLSYAVQGSRKKVVKMVRRPGRKAMQKAVPAFYDHLVNLGTKPHAVGKGSKVGGGKRSKGPQVGGMHPGARPNPFRQRAWDASKGEAGDAALKAMGGEVQKQIAQQSAKVLAQLSGAKK